MWQLQKGCLCLRTSYDHTSALYFDSIHGKPHHEILGATQCWPPLRTDLLRNLVGHAMVCKFVVVCYLTLVEGCLYLPADAVQISRRQQERMQTHSAINIDNIDNTSRQRSACRISSRQKQHQPKMFGSHPSPLVIAGLNIPKSVKEPPLLPAFDSPVNRRH